MLRFLLFALLPIFLSGCLGMSVESGSDEVEPTPDLVMVRPPYPRDFNIDNISISEDGNTFLGWRMYEGVSLLRSDDYSTIEKFYEKDESQLNFGGGTGAPTGDIKGAGFFDHNTWYFGVVPEDKNDMNIRCPSHFEKINVHIRSIQPSREIAKYSYCWRNGDKFIANKNYFVIVSDGDSHDNVTLVDWRTGAHHSLSMPAFLYESGFMWVRRFHNPFTLTDSGRILAKDVYKNGYGWFIFDPFTQQKLLFDPSAQKKEWQEIEAVISPNERYVIDLWESRCRLRKFPSREIAPLNDKEIVGYCSDKLSKPKQWEGEYEIAFSPDGKYFVFAFKRNFRVYRVEPFQLEFEGRTTGNILTVKLSENGMFAAGDSRGFVRVWDVMKKQVIGQHRFYDPGDEDKRYSLLSVLFHPNDEKLYIFYDYLNVFQLPKRATE